MPEKPQRSSDLSLSRSYPCRAATKIGRVAGRVSSAALSTAKTSLRRDRVSDAHHAARLAVCGDCPGGHAVKREDGSLRTCGPMLASLTVEGKSTCGCVLNQKARDLQQACPFGYWESVDRRAAWESVKPRAVVAGLSDMLLSRRSLLGGAAAAGASLLLPQRVRAAGGGLCYIEITPCDQGEATQIHCSKVEGKAAGYIFRNTARGDKNCYRIRSVKPQGRCGLLAVGVNTNTEGCGDCKPPTDCSACNFGPGVTLTVNYEEYTCWYYDDESCSGDSHPTDDAGIYLVSSNSPLVYGGLNNGWHTWSGEVSEKVWWSNGVCGSKDLYDQEFVGQVTFGYNCDERVWGRLGVIGGTTQYWSRFSSTMDNDCSGATGKVSPCEFRSTHEFRGDIYERTTISGSISVNG